MLLTVNTQAFTSHKKDSIITKEKTIYRNNIAILTGLASKVYSQNPQKSLQYARTALEIAKKNKDKESEKIIIALIGKIYSQNDFDRIALPYFSQALLLAEKSNDLQSIAENAKCVGNTYYKLNQIDSATVYLNKSLLSYTKLKDKKEIGTLKVSLGNTYWYIASYDKALELYQEGLDIYESINYKIGIAEVYTNIGSLYTLLGNYQNALLYYRKALQFFTNYQKQEQLANLYYRYGDTFEKLNQFDSAFYYLNSAKILLDSLHMERTSGNINQTFGSIYFKQGKTEKAIQEALVALQKYKKYDYSWGIASIYNNLATYYLKQEDFTNTLEYLQKSNKLSKEINSIELLKFNYLNFSEYYKSKNNYKKALDYYTLFQQMNDSVLTKDKNTRIAELQTKYETAKKEKELRATKEEILQNNELIKRQKRNLYLFGIGIILILLLSSGLYWQYKLLEIKGKDIQKINQELDQRVRERTAALQLTQFSVEQAADSIFWLDQSGNFIFANNAACNYFNFTKNEFLQTNITTIIPKFTLIEWKDIWEIIRIEGALVMELQFNKKNQETFPVEIALNYITHEGKEYAFAFIRDITDRKQKEENLRKAKEKAEEADKLKSAFLANMSHEIRTPMNAILGFSDLLMGESLSDDDKQEFANIIKSSAATLLKLIDDIIDISLIDAGQLKMNKSNFQLNNILKEINRFYQEEKIRLLKPHIDIRLNETTFNDRITLYTDPVRFRQIVTNLVGNALKFIEKGFIEIGYVKGSDKVKIFVKDTGIGIPQDKIHYIFERFNKLNESNTKLYSGTGLGLAISKKMVEQMGGNISAASEIGKGSIFWFTIPFEMGKEIPELPPSQIINSGTQHWHNKSLLIVEDVESNFFYLEAVLKKTEIKIFWAKDGKEALDFC
jgi:PAS domain S-box-containing protein